MMTLFNESKYTKWYFHIIESARNTVLTDYTESHHIVPKSLGGTNDSNNLVDLTARQHLICHKLLVKMVGDKSKAKMIHALWRMVVQESATQQRYKINSRTYEFARKAHSEMMSRPFDEKYGTDRSAEIRKKQSLNHRTHNTEATKQKIRESIKKKNKRWYTDGKESKSLVEGTQPVGWNLGRASFMKNKWKWYNDGTESLCLVEGTQPAGWVLGKVKFSDKY